MPPKKVSQGNKAKEDDALGEHHKPAKEAHQLTPNSKLNAKVEDQQKQQKQQKLIALMKRRNNKPNQDGIYQVEDSSQEAQEQSDNVPLESKELEAPTSWADDEPSDPEDQHEETKEKSPGSVDNAQSDLNVHVLSSQGNVNQQVPSQSCAPPSIALTGQNPQHESSSTSGIPQLHLTTPTRATLKSPRRATHETPEGGLSKLNLPDIVQDSLNSDPVRQEKVLEDGSKNDPKYTKAVGNVNSAPQQGNALSNDKSINPDSQHEAQNVEVIKNLDREFTQVARVKPHECPLVHTSGTNHKCTQLAKWLKSPKLSNAPAITTFTYHYVTGRNESNVDVGANLFAKLLPDQALRRLWDLHPWSLHIGGDDLLKAKPSNVTDQVFFSPFVARPQLNYPTILKDHRSFFFQPQPFQSASHSHGNDVHTMLQHCSFLGKGLADTVSRSGGSIGGWIVLPSYDHHVNASNYLACQSVSFIRDVKRYIKQVVVFNQVSFQIPLVHADGTLAVQHSRKQLQNYVALYLHAGKGNPPMGDPITIDLGTRRDLTWGLERLGLEDTPGTKDTHLRFAIHPGIVEVENITSSRDFYKYINNSFSPDELTNTISSKNCYFPFVNGWVTIPRTRGNLPPPNAGYTVVDYRLPEIKAEVLLKQIRATSDFQCGHLMVYDMSPQTSMKSFFFTPTQNCYHKHKSDWNPEEALTMLTGHVPEGSHFAILGMAIRTSSSLLLHVDLSQYATSEGMSPAETMSKLLFDNCEFLTYRARDGSLVKHTITENPWTLIPEDYSNAKPSLDMAKVPKTSNIAFARAPPTVLMKYVRQVAACLGTIESYKLSELTNTFEQVVEVTYANRESMWLADGFQLGSVHMATAQSYAQARDTLLEIDEHVAEDDRMVAACISAGTRFGSVEALRAIRAEEELLSGAIECTPEDKVQNWEADDLTRESKPAIVIDSQEAANNPEDHNGHNDGEAGTPDKKEPRSGDVDQAEGNQDDMISHTKDPESKYKFGTTYNPSPKSIEFQKQLKSMVHVEAPKGLTYIPNYITEDEEQSLLKLARGWKWDQEVSTRQTAQFGFHYEYLSQNIRKGRPWPEELEWLRAKLVEDKIFEKTPDEMIATKLTPPNGFWGHIDHKKHFGPTIVNLGMQAEVNIVFINYARKEYHILRSERRSLLVIQDEARYDYHHAIPEGLDDEWRLHTSARGVRISLTLRNMNLQHDEEVPA